MATAKDAHTLLSYYEKGYSEKYGEKPVFNRVTARWSADGVLQSLSMKEAKELVDFYFRTLPTAHDHRLDWFFWNYDSLIVAMSETQKEEKRVSRLLEESEQRAREWKERRANKRTTDD